MRKAAPTAKRPADLTCSNFERKVRDRILTTGIGGRAKAKHIAADLGIKESAVREAVHGLRQAGYCIASDTYGYFVPVNTEAAKQTSRHLWSRVRAIAEAARAYDHAMGVRFGYEPSKAEQIGFVFDDQVRAQDDAA